MFSNKMTYSKAVNRFILWSRRDKLSQAERAEARGHIKQLFMAGFSPAEIMFLAGGQDSHWKENTIKKYCRGLEVKDTEMKERALELLRDYIQVDGNWEELAYYVHEKKVLKKEKQSFEKLLQLKEAVDESEINFDELYEINQQLNIRNIDWKQFLESNKTTSDVLNLGYTVEDLNTLYEKTLAYGGMRGLLSTIQYAIMQKDTEKMVQEMKIETEGTFRRAEAAQQLLESVQLQASQIQGHVNFARTLIDEYHIDPISFRAILETAQKYGDTTSIIEAINSFANLLDLKQNIAANTGWLRGLNDEINKYKAEKQLHEIQVNELYRKIGVIEEKQRTQRAIQNISDLMANPSQANIGPMEFMILAQAILLGIRAYALNYRLSLPKWNLFIEDSLETIVRNLNTIISEGDGKTS